MNKQEFAKVIGAKKMPAFQREFCQFVDCHACVDGKCLILSSNICVATGKHVFTWLELEKLSIVRNNGKKE